MQRDKEEEKKKKRIMVCIKANCFHIMVIIMSGAIVLHMYFAQTAKKGWLNLLIAALPDISDDSVLFPISLLFLDDVTGEGK